MSILAIAQQQGIRVSEELEKCSRKDSSWIRREIVSRAIYLVGCYAIALFAIAYHAVVFKFQVMMTPIYWIVCLIPSSRVQLLFDRAFLWLRLDEIWLQKSFIPFHSALLLGLTAPILTVVAYREKSMRRVVRSLLLVPRTPRSRLFHAGQKAKAIWTRMILCLKFFALKEGSFLAVYGGTVILAYRIATGQWPSLLPNSRLWVEDTLQNLAHRSVEWKTSIVDRLPENWTLSG